MADTQIGRQIHKCKFNDFIFLFYFQYEHQDPICLLTLVNWGNCITSLLMKAVSLTMDSQPKWFLCGLLPTGNTQSELRNTETEIERISENPFYLPPLKVVAMATGNCLQFLFVSLFLFQSVSCITGRLPLLLSRLGRNSLELFPLSGAHRKLVVFVLYSSCAQTEVTMNP